MTSRSKLISAVVAAAALIGAFLISDVPRWLRFGATDHGAAANGIRIVLLVVGVAIIARAMQKGSGLWVDTLLLAAAALIAIATVKAYFDARPKNTVPEPSTVTFDVPFKPLNAKELPSASRKKGSDVVLLVVRRERDANGAVTISTHRYKAKLVADYPSAPQSTVAFSIDRGNDDEQAVSFTTDLQQLRRVYVLSKSG
jgi:hypothetical protein